MGSYIPSVPEQQKQMLEFINASSTDALFDVVPDKIKLNHALDIPTGSSENAVKRKMETFAVKNTLYRTVFRGAGAYRHYIPSIVKSVVSKEEFLTAYTPYQPEISQGILQSIFEY